MATRRPLASLAEAWHDDAGHRAQARALGGVEAARRVAEGEPVDVLVLDEAAMHALEAAGHLRAGSLRPLVVSPMVVAVRSGEPAPPVHDAEALRAAVCAAPRVGISTGPSGVAMRRHLADWGLDAPGAGRIVVAAPGEPVGQLLLDGRADIGFQQWSELMGLEGVAVAGLLPAPLSHPTTYGAALGRGAREGAQALLDHLGHEVAGAVFRRFGLAPCTPAPSATA
jgi:molybdate transport system substrate-binding protein